MSATAAKPKRLPKPTVEQFLKYQAAYDHFNRTLFGGSLAPCLLVFRDGRARPGFVTLGHFAPHRWTRGERDDSPRCHEISLNPEALRRPVAETMGTLVHEMAHQWQQDHGKPPSGGYHDRQWAAKMIDVGLVPSNTGQPGGKQTGRQMTHYVQAGGPFERALAAMPAAVALPWVSGVPLTLGGGSPEKEKRAKQQRKVAYECPGCEAKVWGKPDLNVICGECDETYTPAD